MTRNELKINRFHNEVGLVNFPTMNVIDFPFHLNLISAVLASVLAIFAQKSMK